MHMEVTTYDYSRHGDLAATLQGYAKDIRNNCDTAVRHVIRMGRDLRSAQGMMKAAGTFVEWVEAEFKFSVSSAYRYMKIADGADRVPSVENFTQTALLMLSSDSVPEAVAEEAGLRAAAGETVDAGVVGTIIDEHCGVEALTEAVAALADDEPENEPADDEAAFFTPEKPTPGLPQWYREAVVHLQKAFSIVHQHMEECDDRDAIENGLEEIESRIEKFRRKYL